MLKIYTEFHDGIMFVRLDGKLSKNEVHKFRKEVTSIILENKIEKVVFNLSNIKYIDKYGIKILLETNKINEKSMVCNASTNLNGKLYELNVIENELEALKLC